MAYRPRYTLDRRHFRSCGHQYQTLFRTHKSANNMGTHHPTTEIETGSSNIFTDLGFKDADGLSTLTALGIQVMKTIREKELSQKEAGKLLGLKQPEVSPIMRAKFSRFSQERLIGFLNKLEQKVTIQVSRHHRGEPYQQVTVAR